MAVAPDRMFTVTTGRRRVFAVRRQASGLFFVLPAVVLVTTFFFIPLVLAAWVSLHDWPLFGAHTFLGIDNYVDLWSDDDFWSSLWFTTRYAVLVTPCIFVLGFVLALLLHRPRRGVAVFRTLFILPYVVGFGAACLLWYYLLNDQFGIINATLRSLGLLDGSLIWLAEYDTSMMIILAMVVWKTAGGTMLLLLIGMQAIPEDVYEAAALDGAGGWTRLRTITMPLLKRTFALALVLSVTGSYLAFDQFYILTRGGPQNETVTIVFLITTTAFNAFDVGYASTISIVLLGLLIVLSSVQLYLLRDSTQY